MARSVMEPNDEEIRRELDQLSQLMFATVGLEGYLCPTLNQFQMMRSDRFPAGNTLLKAFGLPTNAAGWRTLVEAFGFTLPTPSEIQTIAQRQREAAQRRAARDDDTYPLLNGKRQESVTYVYLGEGRYLKKTRTIFELR